MKILTAILTFCFFAAGIFTYFSIYTTTGSTFITSQIINQYVEDDFNVGDAQGDFNEGITFNNIELSNIKNLPEGTILKIHRLYFNLTKFSVNGLEVEVDNARLRLPNSNPVLFSGSLKEGQVDANIFSKGFTLTEILSYLPDFKSLIPLKGAVGDVDLYITGDYLNPFVKGNILIEKFIYKSFLLLNAPLNVDIQVKDIKRDVKLFGRISMEQGELETKRTKVKLSKSSVYFSGLWNKPRIDLKGTSTIDRTLINIVLKGTIEKPALELTSTPPFSKQKLMIMLATGKSWQSVENAFDTGLNSGELTKDFIDYFFFAGKSGQFAEKFGISDFSIDFDDSKRGVGAQKNITDKLKIGYGIEQERTEGQAGDVSHKIESSYKVTNQVSVGVEREIKAKQESGSTSAVDEQLNNTNDKVFIKYKKSF